MDYKIVHIVSDHKFQVVVDNHKAFVEYLPFKGGMKLTHTIVPSAIEGRGIAATLVKAALEYARENSLKIIPLCSYVITYIKRHPEYSELINTSY